MINKKFTKTLLLITMVLALVSFTGCKKSSDTNYEPEGIISEEVVDYDSLTDKNSNDDTGNRVGEDSSDNLANLADEIKIYGEVTAISNNEITLSLGTLNTLPRQDKNNEDSETTNAVSGATDKVKSVYTNSLTLSGEKKTITITDESIITLQKSDSSITGLDAIEVGNTLKIVYTHDSVNNETLTVIEIL